ncbi:MAG: hypothetical protein JXB49_35130 [Bacteroidales bacterium]|nr:hypothetical protein [Bacteroidales bacterium]
MPLLEIPRTDDARITFLQRVLIAAEKHKESGYQYLSNETIERIFQFLPSYEAMLTGLNLHRMSYENKKQLGNNGIPKLEAYILDLWEVLKRRVIRNNEPAEVLTYYQLPLNGTIPKIEYPEEWIEIAYKIILGDTAAQNKGYPAMINPSVKELHKILMYAEKKMDIPENNFSSQNTPDHIENLRHEANELIMDIIHELRFNLRRKDANEIRQIMSVYGASFSFLKGEKTE